jgi:hypothetical protein
MNDDNSVTDMNMNLSITSTPSIPTTISTGNLSKDDVILNLKIIAQIRKHDKLWTNGNTLSIDSGYVQSVRRYLWSQSRDTTLNFIQGVINKAFEITSFTLKDEVNKNDLIASTDIQNTQQNYFDEDNSKSLHRFGGAMKSAVDGLKNLRETYRDDVKTCSNIDLMIENLQTRTNKIEELLKIGTNTAN